MEVLRYLLQLFEFFEDDLSQLCVVLLRFESFPHLLDQHLLRRTGGLFLDLLHVVVQLVDLLFRFLLVLRFFCLRADLDPLVEVLIFEVPDDFEEDRSLFEVVVDFEDELENGLRDQVSVRLVVSGGYNECAEQVDLVALGQVGPLDELQAGLLREFCEHCPYLVQNLLDERHVREQLFRRHSVLDELELRLGDEFENLVFVELFFRELLQIAASSKCTS